jgi:hypothetical protein
MGAVATFGRAKFRTAKPNHKLVRVSCLLEAVNVEPLAVVIERVASGAECQVSAKLVDLIIALALASRAGSTIWCGHSRSVAAADSSPLRRMYKLPGECCCVGRGSKAVPDHARWQIHIHVPIERALIEPCEHLHGDLLKRERDLVREVSVDLEYDAHFPSENISGTRVKPLPLVVGTGNAPNRPASLSR